MTVPEKGGRPTLRQLAEAKWRDRQWLQEQLETGISIAQLAVKAQCTEKTLREWLRKFRLYEPQPVPELGKVYARDARMWENPDWLRKMRSKGHNVRQIGEMAGVSGQTIATSLALLEAL
jgi:lambda repressor-like predicted transcriptional regulator